MIFCMFACEITVSAHDVEMMQSSASSAPGSLSPAEDVAIAAVAGLQEEGEVLQLFSQAMQLRQRS